VIAGVGGTGVVTAGSLLGLAAFIEGKEVLELAQTGLAQKFGAVLSHVRIGSGDGAPSGGPRVAEGQADVLLAADLLVAAAQPALTRLATTRSAVIANSHEALPPTFIHDRDLEFPGQALLAALARSSRPDGLMTLDATRYAAVLLGDEMLANVVLLGAALQLGLLPVSVAALERAFETLGSRAADNRAALALGRYAVHDPQALAALCAQRRPEPEPLVELDEIVAHRIGFLTAYQDADYAARYDALVRRAQRAETAISPASEELTRAVAKTYFQLLAYKDEYEVARLYTETGFLSQLRADYDEPVRIAFEFAVPFVSRIDPASGRPRKREFGPWIVPVLRLLARLRFLRGGLFDVFGYSRERRLEKRLIREYETLLDKLLDELDADRLPLAIALASLAGDIRGFGPVKASAAVAAEKRREELLGQWNRERAVTPRVAVAARS
jgi:indolepyruvate ferredoxin oxidoreductase